MLGSGLTNTVGVKRKQMTTKEVRLAALTAAEEEERKRLAEPFVRNYRPGHFKKPLPRPITKNPYYLYFKSSEGDEAAARSLLPELPPMDDAHSPASASVSPTAKKQTSRSPHKKPEVDLTLLKPKCAELYVKLEKLYVKMEKEDKEFARFRKDFLARERQRKLDIH